MIAADLATAITALTVQNEKTSRAVDRLATQVGGLGNKFGSFTEGLALPSLTKVLMERFHVDVVAPGVLARRGPKTLEIDVLGYSNGNRNEAYVIEVKSHLDDEAIDQLKNTLAEFPRFFPEHRDKELYGILAGVHVSENVARRARKEGLYLARIADDVFSLAMPQRFRPKSFKPLPT